ncbi:unnamed protein product [Prorocentrum cordatum]|uniref:EF-hand domain-containing protein n=1 Tax=Prorocentrum cordatum TaxID=2364126 RepID=A0ABN9Q5G4_9DINO|nr:unnamed protein product [Polarella glacialis]
MSHLSSLFDQLDTNGDGVISRAEYAAAGRGGRVRSPPGGASSGGLSPAPMAVASVSSGAADIEAIEVMKSEHYAAQMSLNKEQVAIFSRDMDRLQQAVAQLQERPASRPWAKVARSSSTASPTWRGTWATPSRST